MSAHTGRFLLVAASLAVTPALVFAQDRAVPRGSGGGSSAGGRHSSPGVHSSGSSGSSSSSSSPSHTYSSPSVAERRHPRAGTGRGSGGYYPGYPGYPGWGGGWYRPGYGYGYGYGYGGYWWPYGYYGWYGGYPYGGWGYPGAYGGVGIYYSERSQGASLRVLVNPAEARVYVDGYYAGVVDDFDGLLQRLHVTPGRHEITVKLEGYKSHRMRVYVGPDATLKLHYDMEKGTGETMEDLTGGAPPPEREVRNEAEEDDYEPPAARFGDERSLPAESGKLRLSVEPQDASVYVDGAFRGSGREAQSLELAPGRHRIEVVRPGFRTAERDVEVPAGETTRLEVTLERPSL